MFFLGAKKLNPEVGCAAIFDSRLIHRGSAVEKSKFNEVNFIEDKNHAFVPEKKSKYSFYFQMGTFDSTESYFYDCLKRKYTLNELQTWLKQIDIIRNFDNILWKRWIRLYCLLKKNIYKN